ncbi:BrxA family protein [Clostridium sp.]|uniref:BrxA family protein n=1 Tax=Clostridium sp. TaxID=1506 RepID=UPI00359FED7F
MYNKINTAPLYRNKKAARLILKGFNDSEIKNMAIEENIFQMRSEARKKKLRQ